MNEPENQRHLPFFALVALQAVISAAGLVVEIVAGRMIAPYVGMSLYTWTSIIAVVLAGFSLGHWWGGRLAAKETRAALQMTGWTLLGAALTTAAATLVLRGTVGPVLDAVQNPIWAIVLISSLAFFLPSFFAGVPAPVLAVVAMRRHRQSEHALGVMFAAGSIGAIAGTLLSGFVFISWLGSIRTLMLVSAIYAISALICFFAGGKSKGIPAATLGVIGIGLLGLQSLTLRPICTTESAYFCLRTVPISDEATAPINLMVIDHLAHGVNAREAPTVMHTDHTAMLDALPRMRMQGSDFSSFHIGGGSYSLPRAWQERGLSNITIAEIDPAVTQLASQDFWFDPDGTTILHRDARAALKSHTGAFDVIIGDAFTDITVPAHLVTQEFFQLVSARLTPRGVFAMNVVDDIERLQALSAILRTLNSVFSTVEVWTEATAPSPGERRVFVLLAGSLKSAQSEIVAKTPEPKRFAALDDGFLSSILNRTSAIILTDDHAPIDRLMGIGRH